MRAATTIRTGLVRRAKRRPPGRLDSHKNWTGRRGQVTGNKTTTQTWTLDPIGRLGNWTSVTGTKTNASKTNHYNDAGGDSPTWIAETSDASQWTANVTDMTGNLAVIVNQSGTPTYNYTGLHGDVIATAAAGAATPTVSANYDEFGNNPGAAVRYGWLGGKQRSADDMGGLLLMGLRLYAPLTGRFLQVDPITGGSANPYDYAGQDSVNNTDLRGESYQSDGAAVDLPEYLTTRDVEARCGCKLANPSWGLTRLTEWVRYQFSARGVAGHLLSYSGQRVCIAFVIYFSKGRMATKAVRICSGVGYGLGSLWKKVSGG